MGRIDRGVNCMVQGCKNRAERSLSREQVSGSGLPVLSEGRRAYLCRDHYREWKKREKGTRSVERARWGI